MYDPVEIYIGNPDGEGWRKSTGWTSVQLSRSKEELTGSLTVDFFFGYVPQAPVEVDYAKGREILVYIDGWLSFRGLIDKRSGKGSNSDSGRAANIGPNQYEVTLSARGLSKSLIDSSHEVKVTLANATTESALRALVAPWGIHVDWQAEAQPVGNMRFRDGARVIDEISRIARENSHYVYETRSGSLLVTDRPGTATGPDLVLGRNIATFRAEQSEVTERSSITVKGQRNDPEAWGEEAVLPNIVQVTGSEDTTALRPLIVQHYGDGTEKSLTRRALFEANERNAASKSVTVGVFGVASGGQDPWDVGLLHRVQIPCEGLDAVMECTDLVYSCTATELTTTLTLRPIPESLAIGTGGLPSLSEVELDQPIAANVFKVLGNYPAPWTTPRWSFTQLPVLKDLSSLLAKFTESLFGEGIDLPSQTNKPPERLR